MQRAELAILYTGDAGRALTVARVADRGLLLAAAEAAIDEAQAQAEQLAEADPILGRVQHEDAERLRRVLGILLPELAGPSDPGPRVRLAAMVGGRE
jgi:hypothetical protein